MTEILSKLSLEPGSSSAAPHDLRTGPPKFNFPNDSPRAATKLNLPQDILDKLRSYFPWETSADLFNAELRCLSWGNENVNAELTKLKDLSAFLEKKDEKYVNICSEEQMKLSLAYDEFVKNVPFIKCDPNYDTLSKFDKYKIDDALGKLIMENPQKRLTGAPHQSVSKHLEVLFNQVQSYDHNKMLEVNEYMPSVAALLGSVNRQIKALEKASKRFDPALVRGQFVEEVQRCMEMMVQGKE